MTIPLEIKLESVLMEMPYVLFLDKPDDEVITIPGTDKSFRSMIDLRLERWATKDYNRISYALSREGVVGQANSGVWVFFRTYQISDPTVREASVDEVKTCEHLPNGWEDQINLDGMGE